jgi:transketolase
VDGSAGETLSATTVDELKETARRIRCLVLRSVHHAGAGHVGGPLSAADILAVLYFRVLRIDPARPDWPERDRFILSKGHSAIGLYSALALRGYFPVEELHTFDAIDSRLQGHPDMTLTPGVDMSSGSLGQGLSPGMGMALGARLRGIPFRTWVLLGDGEIQEGQVWEAAEVAARYGLDNLTAIVDYNGLPQFTWPDFGERGRERPTANLPAKWEAFGWRVLEADGHDVESLLEACALAQEAGGLPGGQADRPSVIIAHTVKGKGVSFMENNYLWHARPLSDDELRRGLLELGEQP